MKNYFQNCTTLDEAKKEFYNLAKIHHPDRGGETATMQEILNQFGKFTPTTEKFAGEKAQWNSVEFSAMINDLMAIPEIAIEVIGSFIWISGNTKPHKDAIKAVNPNAEKYPTYKSAMWHSTKLLWYFSPSDYKRYAKKGENLSMDEIRNKYGSQTVGKRERPTLA